MGRRGSLNATGLVVRLSDGRCLRVPFEAHAFLRQATREQRLRCVIEDKGTVLWWDDLLEGISLAGLLGVSEGELEEFAGVYR